MASPAASAGLRVVTLESPVSRGDPLQDSRRQALQNVGMATRRKGAVGRRLEANAHLGAVDERNLGSGIRRYDRCLGTVASGLRRTRLDRTAMARLLLSVMLGGSTAEYAAHHGIVEDTGNVDLVLSRVTAKNAQRPWV
ncbi:hypothetical protein PF005_g21682 [Phytophthora fragariae]|uniref:Uncharacterized protein n=1 Tax=Phytophthora fragariae TaxID=53985 RepID=A0A6A3WKY8_9STRA|nr:hypothetical protein PF005_g21682 [Phytophthora fragariae]